MPEPRFDTDAERTYFTTTLPIHPGAAASADDARAESATPSPDAQELLRAEPGRWRVLELSLEPLARGDLQKELGVADRLVFRRTYLNPLIEAGLLALTLPESPRAPTQRYVTTGAGRALLDQRRRSNTGGEG